MPEAVDPCRSALALEIIEGAEDGFVAFDGQFRFTYANPEAERLLGKKEAELVGRSQWEAFPATAGTPVETEYRRAMEERVAVSLESFSEPRQKWYQVHASPSMDGGLVVRFRDLTGRKHAEEELRRLNAGLEQRTAEQTAEVRRTYGLLDGIMAGTNDKIATQDAGFRYTAFNEAYKDEVKKVFGVDIEVGMSMADVLAGFPEDQRKAMETWGRALGGETFTVEQEFGDPARQRNWYQLHFFPIRDRHGAIMGAGQIVRDVSERRRAEAAVRAERQRFSDVLDQLPAYLVLLSPDYHVPFANRFFRERFGESHGLRCYEYLFERTEPCEICESYTVLKTNAPHHWEWTGPDGRNYDIYDFPFKDTDGSTLIMEVGLDITERKQAGAELEKHRHHLEELVQERTRQLEAANTELEADITARKRAEEELRRNREWLRVTLTSIGDAVMAGDTEGRITFLNPVAATLTGWTAEEALGQPIRSVLNIINEDTRQPGEDLVRRALKERRPVTLANHSALVTKDGREVPIEDSAAPILDAAGNVAGVVLVFHDVTEKRRALEALRESEERFRVALQNSPISIYHNDRDLRYTWSYNPGLGYAAKDILAKRDDELLPPESVAELMALKRRVLATGQGERRQIAAELHGQGFAYDVTAEPLRDRYGEVIGLTVATTDITPLKQAEKALRESQADLNRAQAVAQTGSWRLDVRRNELLWSDETYRMFGIPKGTPLTYEAFLATVHPEDREYVHQKWTAALRGERYAIEHRIVVGDRLKWVRERAELEFDREGRLLGGFGTVQDITGRKAAEQRIRHHNAVLQGVNRIFSEAMTHDTDEDLGRICLAVAEEVTGSKFGFLAEINAQGRLEDIAISDPGWKACRMENPTGQRKVPTGFAIRGIYGRVLLDGKGFYTNETASHPDRIGTPEGHPPLEAFLGVPLKHDGKTIGLIAVANREGGYRPQDLEALEALALAAVQILMRKRAEQAVRAGEERLRQAQKMESIGLLAGGIAHDFNNLLATIMGNASLLRDEVLEESGDKLEAVIQATEKAADLTRQLLAYAGKGRFVVEPLDLSRIVREMTDLLGASIPKKVNLKLALKPRLPGIEADRGQLQQIVMNLLINGAEAIGTNQSGTVTITTKAPAVSAANRISDEITGEALAPGKYVCLEVADTGCGMDKETRAKIFDPFFTTKFMGRGLGLAAVAGIVRAHYGAIQLDTAPGRGSTFRVFLPAGAVPVVPRRDGRPSDLRGSETVLLVDDEAMVRDFIRGALERYGYSVLVAKNGREAVRIFKKNAERIRLVLLDLLMPVMGGDEAIGLLKNGRPDLRVIGISGYSESEALRMFAGKGVSGFLQKPFTATRLAEEVKAVLADAAGKRSDQL